MHSVRASCAERRNIEGFPYYLAWCQGGVSMINSLLAGTVIGSIVKA